MHHLLLIWFGWVKEGGYLGIIALMAMESSIFPVPSELVMPPAAFMATLPGATTTFWGVVLAGTFGSWLGSAITYWIARLIGRPLIIRYGRYFMLSESKIEQGERWMHRYEAGGIFFARLLPVIRHLISIPAGIIKMNFWVFSLATTIGSALWCWVLSVFGEKVIGRHPKLMDDPEELVVFMKAESLKLLLFIVVFAILYFVVRRLTAPSTRATTPTE